MDVSDEELAKRRAKMEAKGKRASSADKGGVRERSKLEEF